MPHVRVNALKNREGTMAISRRTLLTSALAGTTLAAVGGTELISAFTSPASAASAAGDVVAEQQQP
jgi:hypothetical protein